MPTPAKLLCTLLANKHMKKKINQKTNITYNNLFINKAKCDSFRNAE